MEIIIYAFFIYMGNHLKREKREKRNYTKTHRKNRHNKTRRHQTGGRYNLPTNANAETHVYLIHSAGCIHCIQLKPEWEKFVKEFENKAGIKIRDIEASSDDFKKIKEIVHPNVNVEGFPTILKKKGKNNKPIQYTGGRTAEEIGKWAQQ